MPNKNESFFANCCSILIVRKLCCVALSAMSVAHSVVVTYNAALNRPSYQSSVYTNRWGSYPARFANDGSRETVYIDKDNKPRCALSNGETNPWWSVDLGGPTTVYKVDFTNRDPSGTVHVCGYFVWSLASFHCCHLPVLFTVKPINIILSHCVLSACHCGPDESNFFQIVIYFFTFWMRS